MPVEVRPLTPVDRGGWEPLWRGYQTFYGRDLPQAMIDLSWQRFMDPALPLDAFGAFAGGRMVGMAHTVRHLATSFEAPFCYLNDLFVDPETRGTGAGRSLIEAVYAFALAQGCGRVYWSTHETNATAMRLYDQIAEKSGFLLYRHIL
ncbi:GNAT family N-acetyltransferase [Phreatobacter aquaticus]|uniref:GNAT family N-acetyltransferase n=1 Tax=Phreatobacter aquaticus TaxID=2570229 RepID=A0A4D7QK08_9HYPH|nr:GNAT family N-acetyltransferase [Phreatobacter aquaticus]QCK88020.1 GNAT family N-acetyltransferase [Phreatobacter aquaticus]